MNILDWIKVGKVSAERDDLLSKYFHDNGVLKTVIGSPTFFLVLGRKGAGKTAVFKYLKENPRDYLNADDVLVSLSLEDYKWSIHSLLKNFHAAESLSYKQSWSFVILVEAIKAYIDHYAKAKQTPPKCLSRCNEILKKLFDDPTPSIYSIIGDKLLRLSKAQLPSIGLDLDEGGFGSINLTAGEVSFEEVKGDSSLQEQLSKNIENVINILETGLARLSPKPCRVFLAFDRIDEAWNKSDVDLMKKVIAGLVSAADSVTSKYEGNIRPIIFLREDIFEVLPLNDLNKLREDCGSLLKWNKDSLFELILKRVNYFGKLKGIPVYTDVDTLFDKTEMRQRTKPSNYLLKRSMMRPRDLICLLEKTIKTVHEKVHDPFIDTTEEIEKLQAEAIYDAEPDYSDWLKKELIDEWAVQYPTINMLLDAIQTNGMTNITKSELNESIQKGGENPTDGDLMKYLRFLFDNSIIGFRVGDSNIWKYKCFHPSQGFVESDDYKIHDGLIRVLNLKEPRGRDAEIDPE
jgi:hypothetical protein